MKTYWLMFWCTFLNWKKMVRGTDNTSRAKGNILRQPLPTMKFLLIAATIKYWVAFYFHKFFFMISSKFEGHVVYGNNKCRVCSWRENVENCQFSVLSCGSGGRLGGSRCFCSWLSGFWSSTLVDIWVIDQSGGSTTAPLPSIPEHTSLTLVTLSCCRHTWFLGSVMSSFTVVWRFLFAAPCP